MVTLSHPTLPGITRQVTESAAAEWVAQGWVRPAEPPAPQPPRPRRAATTKEK